MLGSASLWSGQHLCEILMGLGISPASISACSGNEQTLGAIVLTWVTLVLVMFGLFSWRR